MQRTTSSIVVSPSITASKPLSKIERVAVEQGMRPIFDNGLLAVIEGDTTIEEVVRCIRSEA